MKIWLNVIIFLFLTNILFSGTTGKISGKVTDVENGEPLPGTNVLVVGTTMGASTDLEGYFVILNVPPGIYTIETMMMGYNPVKITNIKISIDFTTRVDFQLQSTILEMGEGVVIIAERAMVRKDLTSSLSTVSSEEIDVLPVEDFSEVLTLQAGIVEGADGSTHIRGGRASEIAYLIDGVSVTDPFSGELALEVENAGVQELQVISGTYNAEYGQAMSGIVEIATKEGGKKFSGNISMYVGDYVSSHNDIFLNIDDVEPLGLANLQMNLDGPVPLLKDKLFFFVTGRYFHNKGWMSGRQYVTPGYLNTSNSDSVFWAVQAGDSSVVAMNPYQKISLQGKLTYKISPLIKLSYGFFWDKVNSREYDHSFKFNPDGDYRHYKNGYTHLLTWNHMISPTTFYTIKFSNAFFDFERYVYEDPLDSRYVDPQPYKGKFYDGGTKLWHLYRNTTSFTGKFDLTSQISRKHQIKWGAEARKHKLYFKEFKLLLDWSTGYKPQIPDNEPGDVNFNEYTHHPVEAAIYFQDKIEYLDVIINAGIRYDFFDPDGKVPIDDRDPDNAKYFIVRMSNGSESRIPERDYDANRMEILDIVDIQNNPWVEKYEKADFTHKISPRIGIAYPITERGTIHFSYGHFFQTPPLEYLYHNSEFEVRSGPLKTDTENKMGNAALKPQETVIYEIGLQQQLTEDIAFDFTGYYKDIRNLLGTEIIKLYDTRLYARYVNRDYGNVRGFTFALKKRHYNYFSASVDYTYQIAEGNASDPNDAFLDAISGRESEFRVVPLDWDQRHTLNIMVNFSKRNKWGVSILGRLGSGLPYTYEPPQTGEQFIRFENNERKPANVTVDLNSHMDFQLGDFKYTIFLKVYNIFDHKNEIVVYQDTGRSGYTLSSRYWGDWQYIATAGDFVNRADYYSQPRRVILGMSLGF